jgi:diacylglycerol O-acyltransferase
VGALLIFGAGDLMHDERRYLDRVSEYVSGSIPSYERYRQVVKRIPVLRHSVWVDDERFDPRFHVRRASVPAPGSHKELKKLAARLLSQHLDRSRPLWELYIIDGLESDGFALLAKVHHCMVDGVGGMQLLQALLSPFPEVAAPEPPSWAPRRAPSGAALLRAEVEHRVGRMKALFADRTWRVIAPQLTEAWDTAMGSFKRSGKSPFTSPDVSPYRRFEWTRFDLDEVKRIRSAFGGTVNDVLIAVATEAARRFLKRDGVDVASLEGLRAVLPVHTGGSKRRKVSGNRVSMLLADLPLTPVSPRERMQRVVEVTRRLKEHSHQSEGVQLFEEIADATAGGVLGEVLKIAMRMEMFDLILTNVPGPQMPLFLTGAELLSAYPVVPLMPHQNLGIALFSYNGSVFWGVNADWEAFPEVSSFVRDLEASYDALRREASARSPAHQVEPVDPVSPTAN